MNMFMLTITPQIIMDFEKYHVCDAPLDSGRIEEHLEIYEAIKNQNPDLAQQKMKNHFNVLYEYINKIE